MNDPLIRESPYEPGLYFVSPEPGTTQQSIGMTEWKIGDRYKLLKVLGYGSFSCVCSALDKSSGERIALKRIGDVLHSTDQAKRVLREISILRRTSHPNLIGLRDCFLRPSSTGQFRMVGGKLVNCSIDLYIAMEYADGGDLYHMRGQLAPEEVASLLWQLLQALKYLHSLHVWHRDVKSQNAFISLKSWSKQVKLGDFGSARSAVSHEYKQWKKADGSFGALTHAASSGPAPGPSAGPLPAIESHTSMDDDEAVRFSDLYAQPEDDTDDRCMECGEFVPPTSGMNPKVSTDIKKKSGGFKAPLTRVIATPCYRAPEVVMSRGGYSEAVDMWGVGCVFGELLQRVAYVGSAATPNLHVAPLFAIHGMLKTPEDGETFGRPESLVTRRELQALFDVLGTPAWSDAAAVEMPEWRHYLERLPGKAPTLSRRFSAAAGEVAVHLLTRLLEFDPRRRASCEEALVHEFFSDLREQLLAEGNTGGEADAKPLLGQRGQLHGKVGDEIAQKNLDGTPWPKYWEESNPGRALAMLEDELEALVSVEGLLEPCSDPYVRLRKLLEKECAAAAAECAARRAVTMDNEAPRPVSTVHGVPEIVERGQTRSSRVEHDASEDLRTLKEDRLWRKGPGLLEDTAAMGRMGGSSERDYGKERLSNVADTWQGRELDPRKFLGPKRHGEWTAQTGGEHDRSRQTPSGPQWGVSTTPPGSNYTDAQVQAIIRKQQER